MKPSLRTSFLAMTLFSVMLGGCEFLDQASQVINLKNCEFRIKNVDNLNLAGVSVQNIQSLSGLGVMDVARITAAAASGSLPLNFQMNLEGRNSNAKPAGMNSLDWILYIDDIEMTRGKMSKSFTIPANNGISTIPLQFSLNLKEILQGKTLETITNFGLNLAGAGNKPTRFMIKLKPTILVSGIALTYPDYISVRTSFVGK